VEAAGHYHRGLLGSRVWSAGWEVVVLSPARVSEQRRVEGRRRVKTDAIDLEAITELRAGWSWDCDDGSLRRVTVRGWSMHRGRRAWHGLRRRIGCSRSWTAAFRGLTMVLPDVLGKVPGRLGMVVRVLPTRSLTACNRQPSDSEVVHDHIRLRQH
jgi:transposase